jgi:hypothetical protein
VKILIVAAFFPPQNSIASLRPYSWAKWWSRTGHEVTVLTTTKKVKNNDLVMDVSNFDVIELPIPLLSTISSNSKTNQSSAAKKNYFPIWSFLKKIFFSFASRSGCFYDCRFPDFHDLWARKAFKKIESSYFDIVISSGWPYSVHRVGLALKKRHQKIKWIVDWRDLWTRNHMFSGLKIFHGYEQYLENKFHQNADLITTVSDPLANTLRSVTKTHVETIYNGFDPEDYQQIKINPRKDNAVFTIVYTGTIYRRFRDPSPLFEAISLLKQKGIINSGNLCIQFAGANADVSDLAKKYKISDCYEYLGFIPREDALQMQYDADAVLFIEYDDPNVPGILTGKLFEYVYIAKEIIGIGSNEYSTAGNLIKGARVGYCFGTNIEKIKEYLLERVIQKTKKTIEKNSDIIQFFARKNQAERIINFLS